MPRHFNTTGPCKPEFHYMLPPIVRLPNLVRLIEQANYFVIHAPRQTGKSTAMLALAEQLTAAGKFTAVMVSAEVGQPFSQDTDKAERAILGSWRRAAEDRLPEELHPPAWPQADPGQRIQAALRAWAKASPRPLVILIDEIDALRDQALLSMLRQLRDGFPDRPKNFPQSIGLIGLRDVRDYKISNGGRDHLQTSSPFNIKVGSFTLRNFNPAEVAELYAQHTVATGQIFTPEAIQLAFDLTQGQPWLVNALAKEIVEVIAPDPATAITIEHLQIAKETLIRRKDTHLDSLAERLREERVRVILEPIMAGQELALTHDDDRDFLVDLGLLRREDQGGLVIANPIYQEILPRVLAQGAQDSLPKISPTWLTTTGELNLDALREAFMAFWLQHGEPLLNSAAYHEIAPHLVLMAFLHRVVNGGGTLEREYAIGRDRMDLCLRYGAVVLGIEIKVQRDDGRDQLARGLTQIEGYLARLGLEFGWLVIFDRRKEVLPIEQRLRSEEQRTESGRVITVIHA
ncbi:AAA family ATPase [Alkalinema sp. FACHB-956]|uniref:AAA family ATPase n=1 Tax=Alkalinema sp. FACHB-956 TaxID=2692768 RepID=UPI001687D5D7|nr:AAA family ATPase [Alkalinema sp. FACHB-956]